MSSSLTSPRPDLRVGGTWGSAQTLKNAVLRALIRGALFFADVLPAFALLACCRGLARLIAHFPPLRAKVRGNLRLALPDTNASLLTDASFVALGDTLAHTLLLRRSAWRASRWVQLPEEHRQRLADVLARGRGAIVVSAHFGPFEHIAPRVCEEGLPATVVVRESYDPALDACVDRHRIARGVRVVHRGRQPLGALRALRQGHALGLLVDLARRVASEPVRLLGVTGVPFARGPAQLAASLGAPVMLALLHPQPEGGFSLHFEEVPTDGVDLTQRVAARLEQHIRAYPAHWLWVGADLSTPSGAGLRKNSPCR